MLKSLTRLSIKDIGNLEKGRGGGNLLTDCSKKCQQCTLIQFAKFSAKILLMAKLHQNYSNLNDLEYSRHLMARKVEKRPKNFLKAKQRPEVEKPKFS